MNLKDYRYDGTHPLKLSGLPTSAPEEARAEKAALVKQTESNIARAAELQERLYAAGEEALVIALQARDAAGKDSLIKKVFSGLNPAALEVHSFKAPTATELRHDYLWRMNAALPPRGKIALFNRSQYEDVLAVRVHHLEKTYRLAPRCLEGDFFPPALSAAEALGELPLRERHPHGQGVSERVRTGAARPLPGSHLAGGEALEALHRRHEGACAVG